MQRVPVTIGPQLIETSSLCEQLSLPQLLCGHTAISLSVPRQETSSNHILPLPALIFPRKYPSYLWAIANYMWSSITWMAYISWDRYKTKCPLQLHILDTMQWITAFKEHIKAETTNHVTQVHVRSFFMTVSDIERRHASGPIFLAVLRIYSRTVWPK